MKYIDGLGHVAIKVHDVDRSMAFYSGVLEMPEMLRLHHDDGSLFLIYLRITDTQYLEIFPGAETARGPGINANGAHHFCLTVEKLEPVLERVVANGGTLFAWTEVGNGRDLRPTAKPQISNGLDGNRQAWLEDPDGNRIELMEMAPDSLQYKAIARLREQAV